MAGGGARRVREAVEETWKPFRRAVSRLGDAGIERSTPAAWSAKEMLAHVAFWDEAVEGAVLSLFRQEALPTGWAFGSGYVPDPGTWRAADVHNAREAAWGRGQSPASVVARLDAAHARLGRFLESVTDGEATAHAGYFGELGKHYPAHQPELEALLGTG